MFNNIATIAKLSFKSVLNNWARNKIIIMIISVSFILLQFLLAMSAGFGLQVKNFVLDSLIGHAKIMNTQYKIESNIKYSFYLSDEVLDKIQHIKGVKALTKRIQVPVVVKSERKIRNAVLVGIDTVREKNIAFIGKEYPYNKFDQVFASSGILMGKELLDKLETKQGYKVVTSSQDAKDKLIEQAFFVNDIFHSSLPKAEEMFIFTDINKIASIYSMGKNFTEVSILFDDDSLTEKLVPKIEKILPKDQNIKVYTWGDLMPFLQQWLKMMTLFMVIFFIIALVAASIPISNTLLISVLERVHEFGLMQALGMKKIHLFLFIVIEALIIIVMGLIIGVGLGLLISYIFQCTGVNISGFAQGASKLGIGEVIYPVIVLKHTMMVAGVMFFSGILASIYPAIKASLYNPVQALSKRG